MPLWIENPIKLLLSVLLTLCEIISLSMMCNPSNGKNELVIEVSITNILKIILGSVAMIIEKNLVGYCGGHEVCAAE